MSWVGIGLAASSLLVMPYLGLAKQRLAHRLGSAATVGEGCQNMLCAYLAGARRCRADAAGQDGSDRAQARPRQRLGAYPGRGAGRRLGIGPSGVEASGH